MLGSSRASTSWPVIQLPPITYAINGEHYFTHGSHHFCLSLCQPLLVQPGLAGHGQPCVGSEAEHNKGGTPCKEYLQITCTYKFWYLGEAAQRFLSSWYLNCHGQLQSYCELHASFHPERKLHRFVLSCNIPYQLISNLRQSISCIHSPPMVWLQRLNVETGLVVPNWEEVVQAVVGQGFDRRRCAVPGGF